MTKTEKLPNTDPQGVPEALDFLPPSICRHYFDDFLMYPAHMLVIPSHTPYTHLVTSRLADTLLTILLLISAPTHCFSCMSDTHV